MCVTPANADVVWSGIKIPLAPRKSATVFNSGGFLVCDPYQNLHIFWEEDQGEQGNSIYYVNDISGTLTSPLDIYYSPHQIYYNNLVAAANLSGLFLAWMDGVTWDLVFAMSKISSAYDARSWSAPIVIADRVSGFNLRSDKNGNLHIVYAKVDIENVIHTFYYQYSQDNGVTWSNPHMLAEKKIPEPSLTHISLAVDDSQRIFIGIAFRSYDYGVFNELGYFRSVDNGKSWDDFVLYQNTNNGFYGGIDRLAFYTFGQNEVHLTFHGPSRSHSYSLDGGETWSTPELISTLGYAFGGDNVLAKDSSGDLYALYASFSGVYISEYKNDRWSPPEYVDNSPIDAHYQQMVICQGNQLHIVYSGRLDSTIWYATKALYSPLISRLPIDAYSGNNYISPEQVTPSPAVIPTPVSENSPDISALSTKQLEVLSVPLPSVQIPYLFASLCVLILIILVYAVTIYRRRG